MLTSLNRMVGLPVVWQDRQLGYVERAVPDARARRLSGVVVRKGRYLGPQARAFADLVQRGDGAGHDPGSASSR